MKEEIISLDTAILAKEKGYDQQPYRAAYNNSCKAYYPEYTDGSGNIVLKSPLFNLEHVIAIAPTQSLLQRWLREVHSILLYVEHSGGTWLWVIENSKGFLEMEPLDEENELSYEQALEEGIKESLKLINV